MRSNVCIPPVDQSMKTDLGVYIRLLMALMIAHFESTDM